MPKENEPLPYQRRILDTKGLAQRVDLSYQKRPHRFRDWRRRLTWIAPLVAALAMLPLILGVGESEKVFSNGPVSPAHAIFEQNCSLCHASAFSRVSDAACRQCHDGPIHQASAVGGPGCADCHVEHRGKPLLAGVDDRHCTRCHADLAAHARGARLESIRITGFARNRHPEFPAGKKTDRRPLHLNHAAHMPAQPKTLRGMKLPMKCSDCHGTDPASPRGDLLPVSFEQHCRACHKRELEFDVNQILGSEAAPAPHTRDPQTIRNFITQTYQQALASNPPLAQRPLGREIEPPPNPAAWLAAVVQQSEAYLFERKCQYCHQLEPRRGEFPVVKRVNPIRGEHVEGKPEGRPWLARAQFSHRAHRAVDCSSCHRAARASTKTEEVLIPKLENCLPCHGRTGTSLDHCAQCHLYHDKSKEADKDRRPVEQLIGGGTG